MFVLPIIIVYDDFIFHCNCTNYNLLTFVLSFCTVFIISCDQWCINKDKTSPKSSFFYLLFISYTYFNFLFVFSL